MILSTALQPVIQSLRTFLDSKSSESATNEPPAKRRKRGRKESQEQAIHDKMLMQHAIGLVNDTLERSPEAYCRNTEIPHLLSSLKRLIGDEKEMRRALQKDARKNPTLVLAAVEVIKSCLGSSTSQDLQQQVESARLDTRTILNFNNLKDVAKSLDFDLLS